MELLLGLNNIKESQVQNVIPSEYKLNQNYPNPFNPITTISFEIPYDEFVDLKIYDVTGKELMTLVSEFKTSGNYSVRVNGSNLSSGVYFYKLKSGNFEMVRKMVMIK